MRAAARILLAALAVWGWVAAGAPALARSAVRTQEAPSAAVAGSAAEREAFAAALRAFRGGDEGARERLLASGARLAALGRPDAGAIAGFYTGLSAEDRRAGLAAEVRFEALYAEVARHDGRAADGWPARRAAILSELSALAAEQRAAPDPAPAARALSLAAVLDEQRARHDVALARAERDALLSRAAQHARESLELFARPGFLTPTLEPTWLLASVDEARGDGHAARAGFEDCLDLAERVGLDAWRVRALRGLVAVAESTGDLLEQRALLRELAAIRSPRDDAWLTRRWGALLVAEDEPEAARRFLEEHPPSDPAERGPWHFLLGSALQRLGRGAEAEAHFALVRLAQGGDGDGCAQVEAAIFRAQAALDRGAASEALAIAEPLDDVLCAEAARAQRAWTIGAARLELGDAHGAEVALRGALEHGRALEARLARTDDGSVFGEVVGLETVALLADALLQQGRPLEAVRAAEEFQARSLRSRGEARVEADDVRAWAAEFERGLVTWVVGADTTVCAHVGPDGGAQGVTIRLGRERLHEAVRRVREAAIAGDEARARRLALEVEARILPPSLRERVRGGGRLLVLAHGPLERLPFDLTTLADEGPLSVLPGLAAQRPGPPPAGEAYAAWSVLGGPTTPGGASLLPGARAEVEGVAARLGTRPVVGDAFDRTALADALRSGRPLHVATHLVRGAGAGTRDWALAVARGAQLATREIRELGPRLPLAVLAACETADGRFVDAQALSGVSNAFLASGTRNLCVTLWPVEDGAARAWSEAFHRALAAGARPSAAASRARDDLRRAGVRVSEWAAFRFAGSD
ncbi:MAG: CHAT domain-containing protein [Planctomycetes bacterium]|nr:CHAT domain-containing protein [Planctomycetota bacterium]